MRIGILGDVNLNLIDGSSLWVQSLAEAIRRFTPHVPIIISRCDLDPCLPIPQSLRKQDLVVIQPRALGVETSQSVLPILESPALQELRLDVLLVRGLTAVSLAVASEPACGQLWGYVTEFDKSAVVDDELCRRLRAAALGVDWFLVQTRSAWEFLAGLPEVSSAKLAIIPPMIPERYLSNYPVLNRERGIVYAGKFAPDWGVLELHQVATRLAKEGLAIPVTVFGEKVHDPSVDKSYTNSLKAVQAEGVINWRGAVPRDEVIRALQSTRYGWAWRTAKLEESTLEISSKVLETCAAGSLPVCYPSAPNRELLGEGYPLFARTPEEARRRIDALNDDAALLEETQQQAICAIQPYLDRFAVKRLFRTLLPQDLVAAAGLFRLKTGEKPTLLVAGHDLKFASAIIRNLRTAFHVEEEKWRGHSDRHRQAQVVNSGADIIWCEWCLGNAVHFSKNKHPHQRVFIRFHLQEFDTSYPGEIDIDNVESVIFVNDYHRNEAIRRFGWPAEKTKTIPNYVEPSAYVIDKPDGAYFNVAMIGVVPARKRLDRAIDLIEKLRHQDERWTLWIKGRRPSDYGWLQSRPEELAYFERCAKRVQHSPMLRESIRFVGGGPDVPQFLSRMGWLLSPSDFESFHLAVVEAAASGAVPLVWPWKAASCIYDESWIVESTEQAVARVLGHGLDKWRKAGRQAAGTVASRFSAEAVTRSICEVFARSLEVRTEQPSIPQRARMASGDP